MRNFGYEYIIMVKGRYNFVRSIIDKTKGTFEKKLSNFIPGKFEFSIGSRFKNEKSTLNKLSSRIDYNVEAKDLKRIENIEFLKEEPQKEIDIGIQNNNDDYKEKTNGHSLHNEECENETIGFFENNNIDFKNEIDKFSRIAEIEKLKDGTYKLLRISDNSIKSLVIPSFISVIAPYLCSGLNELEYVIISGNVNKIEIGAFLFCCKLKRVILGDGIAYIGFSVFSNCNLSYIYIPQSVKYMGKSVFEGCPYNLVVCADGLYDGWNNNWNSNNDENLYRRVKGRRNNIEKKYIDELNKASFKI